MNEIDEVERSLMADLHEHANSLLVSIDDLEAHGEWRITEFIKTDEWPSVSHSAGLQSRCCAAIPLQALATLSEAAAWMSICRRSETKNWSLMIDVAKHLGLVTGLAFGIMTEDDHRRSVLSRAGTKGSQGRHKNSAALKTWALQAAKSIRGSDMEKAGALTLIIPEYLSKASKNPQRLIYEAIRNEK